MNFPHLVFIVNCFSPITVGVLEAELLKFDVYRSKAKKKKKKKKKKKNTHSLPKYSFRSLQHRKG